MTEGVLDGLDESRLTEAGKNFGRGDQAYAYGPHVCGEQFTLQKVAHAVITGAVPELRARQRDDGAPIGYDLVLGQAHDDVTEDDQCRRGEEDHSTGESTQEENGR